MAYTASRTVEAMLTMVVVLAIGPEQLFSSHANQAYAGLISLTGELQISSVSGFVSSTELEVNDFFNYEIIFDDTVTDTDPNLDFGNFFTAVTHVSFQRNPGNTGSWDPSSATFSFTPLGTQDSFDRVVFGNLSGVSGGVTLGGDPLAGVSIRLTASTLVDTGVGQTFLDQLGNPNLNTLAAFFTSAGGDLFVSRDPQNPGILSPAATFNIFNRNATSVVPVPSAMLLMGSGLVGFVSLRWWHKKKYQ